MKIILIVAIQISLVVVGFISRADGAQLCRARYQNWLIQYGGSDPYQAINKTTPWKIERQFLSLERDQLKKKSAELPHFVLHYGGESYDSADILMNHITVEPLSNRDLSIRANLFSFVNDVDKLRTLKIAYVGQHHAIDLFLAHPELNPTYVEKPYTEATPLLSPGMRDLKEFIKDENDDKMERDRSAPDFLATYDSTVNSMKSLSLDHLPERTFHPTDSNESIVVIGEIHEPSFVDWLGGMPTAKCLKAMGYTKVVGGFEGYPKGTALDYQYLKRDRTFILQVEYRAKKLGISISTLIQNWPKNLRKALFEGRIIDNPASLKFAKKLEEYRKAGLNVEFQGLESPDYDSLENK